MKIVVTGSQGQLGSELCRCWDGDADVVGLDLPEFDVTDRRAVIERLSKIGPQVVVNAAAYTQVDRAEAEMDLCRAVNADGVAHLVEACRRTDALLVQVSTDYVFGRDAARRTPYRETDQPGPLGRYGRSKLEGERHAAGWDRHLIVRTSGLYGRPGPRSAGNFPQTILRLARAGQPLRVVNDQHASPTYVPHLTRAIRFLAQKGSGVFFGGAGPKRLPTPFHGAYHVVNRGQTTWYDFAVELLRLAGVEARLTPVTSAEYYQSTEGGQQSGPRPAIAPRPSYSVLDPGKYLGLAGRPEMPSWQEALAEYVAGESG